ncbi:MAG: hypothetical protein ACM3N4_01360 [Nitrososphaerota archaeon]
MVNWSILGLPIRDIPMLVLLFTIIGLAIASVVGFLRGLMRGLRDNP